MSLNSVLKSTTIADKILLALLILVSLSGIVFVKELLPEAKRVMIEVNGHPVYILPKDKDRTVSVEGPEGVTVIEIKDQRVRVTESPCHNKLCIRQGWIESGAIVCIPNRVVVTISNHEDESNKIVDAITG
ncbi:MAG: hypothetical protein A2Y97_07480 [Nitrospirae bacterium RBG_13_39_12]|nr:MAG: hypothetical protein A2Y97_07480 [Nitrospirae bacterium RBG_13_39_12]